MRKAVHFLAAVITTCFAVPSTGREPGATQRLAPKESLSALARAVGLTRP